MVTGIRCRMLALVRASARERAAIVPAMGFALALLTFAGGCDKSGQIRSTLESDRAAWGRQISALQGRLNDVEAKFSALPAAPASGEGAAVALAQRQRLQASIVGTRQTLIDIQSHIADSTREVEAAIREGDVAGEAALEGVVGRVTEYLRQQEQTLALNDEAMNRMWTVDHE
jgi:hypothetical protein